jgi:hypothetical protein
MPEILSVPGLEARVSLVDNKKNRGLKCHATVSVKILLTRSGECVRKGVWNRYGRFYGRCIKGDNASMKGIYGMSTVGGNIASMQ